MTYYFDEATISRTDKNYKVELVERELTIFVPEAIVSDVCKNTSAEEEIVATLFAYMEAARKEATTKENKFRRINEDKVVINTKELMVWYSIERLIEVVRDLKWHQIKAIFESENPKKKMGEFV